MMHLWKAKMYIEVSGEDYTLKDTFGEINFTVDEDTISVLHLSVSKKRCGIGTSLAKKLEEFAITKKVKLILVPSTPSKEALAFWMKLDYQYTFTEDKNIGNYILSHKDSEYFHDTESGIILLEKNI